jgi:hypothetical protein
MLKEFKEKRKQLPSHCFCEEKKNTKKLLKHCFLGRGADIRFSPMALETNPSEKQGTSIIIF